MEIDSFSFRIHGDTRLQVDEWLTVHDAVINGLPFVGSVKVRSLEREPIDPPGNFQVIRTSFTFEGLLWDFSERHNQQIHETVTVLAEEWRWEEHGQ